MSISTHKMLADAGAVNNAVMDFDNSNGPASKHFFTCTETTSPIVDAIGGLSVPADGVNSAKLVTIGAGDDSGVNTRVLAFSSGVGDLPTLVGGSWDQPGTKDVVILACGKTRIDPADSDGDINVGGFTSLYVGEFSASTFRVQPYQSIFQVGSDVFATQFSCENRVRTEGDIHIYAAVMRGTTLEHWADGVLTGSRDYSEQTDAVKAAWENYTPGNGFATGHSAYCSDIMICTPQPCDDDVVFTSCGISPNMSEDFTVFDAPLPCDFSVNGHYLRESGRKEVPSTFNPIAGNRNSTGEYPDDLYGLYMGVFENAPTDIAYATEWMKAEWVKGNKVVYPGWVSYT